MFAAWICLIPPRASRKPLVSTAVVLVLRVLVLRKRLRHAQMRRRCECSCCASASAHGGIGPRTSDAGLTPLAGVVCKQMTSGITRIGPASEPDSRPHGDVAKDVTEVNARSEEAGRARVNSINLVRHSPAHLGAQSAAVAHSPHPGIRALQEQRSAATATAPRPAPATAAGAETGAGTSRGQVDDEALAPRGWQGHACATQTQTCTEGAGGSFFNADFKGGLGEGICARADGGYYAMIKHSRQVYRSQVMTTVHMAARAFDVLLVRVPLLLSFRMLVASAMIKVH